MPTEATIVVWPCYFAESDDMLARAMGLKAHGSLVLSGVTFDRVR